MSSRPHNRFPHARLDAWGVAIELATQAQLLCEQMPRGNAPLADQLRRAAMSVCLNLAEGAGRWTPKDKAHRFAIARGECGEVAAAIDVAVAMKALPAGAGERAIVLADREAAMLTRLIQRCR